MALGYLVEDGGGSSPTPSGRQLKIDKLYPDAYQDPAPAVFYATLTVDATDFTTLSIGYCKNYASACTVSGDGTNLGNITSGSTFDISNYTKVTINYSTFRQIPREEYYVGDIVFS